jgi:outer membrane protein assembly factor BamB
MQLAPAPDWPLLGGTPARNMVAPLVRDIPTDWGTKVGEKNVRWVARLGDRGYAPPAIAGGQIYIATNNAKPRDPKVKGRKAVLMCFRESDGEFLWQLTHPMPPEDVATAAETEGLLSTPAVEGNRLYYITPAAVVICASAKGRVVWERDLMKEHKVYPCHVAYSSPLVAGNLVFMVTGNGRSASAIDKPVPHPKAPSFVALDRWTGKVVWTDNSPGNRIMEGSWTSPAYAEIHGKGQVIFPGGDGWLYAFEPATGKPIWKFDCNPKGSVFRTGTLGSSSYLMAPPVVCDGKVYIGTGQQPENGPGVGHLWCIDATKHGDVSPELVIATGKRLRTKPNPNSAVVWHFGGAAPPGMDRDFYFGRTMSACAVHQGLVYAVEQEGFLHCLDAKTGQHYWTEDLKANVWASPLWADGKVYVPDESGIVHVLAHGKVKRHVNEIDMEANIKAPVVVANGVLYLVTDRRLYAIGTRPPVR